MTLLSLESKRSPSSGYDCGSNYLSAMLAGLTLSMMMTCLLQYMEVERARPKLEPMVLATSTSSGPEAVATESERHLKTILTDLVVAYAYRNVTHPSLSWFHLTPVNKRNSSRCCVWNRQDEQPVFS